MGRFPALQAGALLACDFFEAVTLSGARLHVLAVTGHASRRIRILGATAYPAASWVAQAARNLVMDLEDAGCRARFLIRDRDGKFPGLSGVILADAGIDLVLSGVRMPRMNSIMERWVQSYPVRVAEMTRKITYITCMRVSSLRVCLAVPVMSRVIGSALVRKPQCAGLVP